jgi:hypothetical protein
MEQAEARAKLAEGAFLVALDVPQGVEFGIDMMVYQVRHCTACLHSMLVPCSDAKCASDADGGVV